MKCLIKNALRCTLFLCAVLCLKLSYAQGPDAKYDSDIKDNSDLKITNGKLSIDLRASSEFNSLNQTPKPRALNNPQLLTKAHNDLKVPVTSSTIYRNLSAEATPELITNVSAFIMQRTWRVHGNSNNLTSVILKHQVNSDPQHAVPGTYYMFISNSGVFDATADFRLMRSDENGALETEYNFNGPTFITFGYAPQVESKRSVYFDGSNDYIDMNNRLHLNPSGFTVSAWVKRDPRNSGTVSIVSKRDDTFRHGYDLRLLNTNQIEIIWKNGSDQSLISNASIPFNEWHHIAAIYNGNELAIYIDGVFDKTEQKTAPIPSNNSFYIGAAGNNVPKQYFNGHIDEVRLWDIPLSVDQMRFIMNQEITENAGQVMGEILPSAISKNDINTIPWSKLAGYYPMSAFTYASTNDASGHGIHGALRNISSVDVQSAPLPYQSIQEGNWDEKSTWKNGNVQYAPGSKSVVDPNTTIDWNIVKTSHYVTMDNTSLPHLKWGNRKLLGLFVDANELTLSGNSSTNEGNAVTVSHYLSLTGTIDLEGDSQLIQDLNSELEVAPSGVLERDQQGPSDTFTYKYWSSPVGKSDLGNNTFSYAVKDVMYDGAQPINFITSGYNGSASTPISIADYWIWKYANQPNNSYSSWQHVRRTGTIYAGEGFTMKGPGTGSLLKDQNYVFRGKPNNGDINLTIHAENDYLVGNPYASAIDANQFIIDNSISNIESKPTISGTLYFWKHWGGDSHFLNDYQGGYATYNFSGGVAAASYGTNDPLIATGGSPTKIPRRYIPVGEGFFVVGNSTGTINFNNGQRTFRKDRRPSPSFLANGDTAAIQVDYDSEESDDRMKFRIGFKSINTIHRQLLLTIDENASAGADWAYDAKINENQMDDMYWMINDDAYIIQASDEAEASTVYPLGIKTNADGQNTVTIDALENVPDSIDIYLHDIALDLYHNLRQSDYEVFLNAGRYHDRFEITFSTSEDLLGTEDETQVGIDILYSNQIEKLVIINPKLIEIRSVALFNMLGQPVYTNNALSKRDYSEYDIKNLSTGTYVIKLLTRTGSIVTKKVLVH